MKKNQNIIVLITIILFASCSTSDNGIDPLKGILNPERGTFSAKVNGQDFSTAYPFVAAVVSDQTVLNNQYHTLGISAVIPNTLDTTALAVVFFLPTNLVGISANQEFKGDNIPFNFQVIGAYNSNSAGNEIDASSAETDIALAAITMIDTVNKIVSGTFSFTAKDSDTDITYQVTDGKFENVEY